MKDYKKTFFGSVVAFFVGTSCCWLSSLAIWVGGATLLGTLITFIEDIQGWLIGLGVLLAVISIYLYFKRRKAKGRTQSKFS